MIADLSVLDTTKRRMRSGTPARSELNEDDLYANNSSRCDAFSQSVRGYNEGSVLIRITRLNFFFFLMNSSKRVVIAKVAKVRWLAP